MSAPSYLQDLVRELFSLSSSDGDTEQRAGQKLIEQYEEIAVLRNVIHESIQWIYSPWSEDPSIDVNGLVRILAKSENITKARA